LVFDVEDGLMTFKGDMVGHSDAIHNLVAGSATGEAIFGFAIDVLHKLETVQMIQQDVEADDMTSQSVFADSTGKLIINDETIRAAERKIAARIERMKNAHLRPTDLTQKVNWFQFAYDIPVESLYGHMKSLLHSKAN
jgi:hypothetical protein